MINDFFKTTPKYQYLVGIIEDMQDGEIVKYDIDKSIEKILNDDYLWDNFYSGIRENLVEERKGE